MKINNGYTFPQGGHKYLACCCSSNFLTIFLIAPPYLVPYFPVTPTFLVLLAIGYKYYKYQLKQYPILYFTNLNCEYYFIYHLPNRLHEYYIKYQLSVQQYTLRHNMGKKTKSKQRLDQYYHFAKTQGYRSRAAYKLIQLNRKYNFLNQATAVIDLCAAPGGWMQVCANTMPPNSTIIGVDLDQIKRVPGTLSFKGDITKQQTYDRLRKQLKGRKCDAVLNDGAPNVGANWSKDAYTQSQLVLAAFKLATDFLKPGGYFVTKVFRSTDTSSLMWVFKKFFDKVQMTKPKASRFTSAETFVVGIGFNAPDFIDERYFDPTHVFKDTEADHFHEQMAGEITSIDKLLQNRRKRGGYEDNAPMHLYKQTTLTQFINSKNPLLIFAQYTKVNVSPQQRQKYWGITTKIPADVDELLKDLKVLGRRQISGLLRWRGKIKEHLYKIKMQQTKKPKKQAKAEKQGDQNEEYMDEEDFDEEDNLPQQQDSEEELEREMLSKKRKELKEIKTKQEKRSQLLIKAQAANEQLHEDQQFGQQRFENILESDDDIENMEYVAPQQGQEQNNKSKKPKYADYSAKQMEANLQEMYEQKQKRRQEKIQHAREVQRQKKQRREQRASNTQHKLKSRRFGREEREEVEQNHQEEQQNQEQKKNEHQFQDFKFKNPLATMDDQDIYVSQNEDQQANKDQQVDPNQRVEGQLSDDDAYVIPKALTDMEKRRKQIKKNQQKRKKKLHKDIQQGEDVGGQIEIVKHKNMEDYDIDSLAETLVIAKKMLRNQTREDIIDQSYRGFSFQDHDDLPKWFTEDEKKHNFKKIPITKEQFKQEKQRLMAINARVPKKILEAKVRRKIRVQKKLRRTQKKAEGIMSQQGITEVNKLRQVGKLYDKSKRQLKDTKKYVIGKRTKAIGGKDSRKVKHVDKRLKKDKRALKRISKTRHVKRHSKKKARF